MYVSNQWSRSSLSYLVNFDAAGSSNDDAAATAMNVALAFTEVQYGLLASVAFTSLYAVASLGAGYAADRGNRKTLAVLSTIGWSAATLGTARADSYVAVVACRIAMGLACAFATPTAYTLIQDFVPVPRRATASSLYGTGVAVGSGLASLTLLLDSAVGWRSALNVIATTGFVAAAASLFLLPNDDDHHRPASAAAATAEHALGCGGDADDTGSSSSSSTTTSESAAAIESSVIGDMQLALATHRARWIYLGSLLRFAAGLCIGVWAAPYYRLVFADRLTDYAVAQAAISAVGASVSGILGGALADRLSAPTDDDDDGTTGRDLVGRRLWVPIAGSVLAAPAWYSATHSPLSFETSMAWLAAEYLVAECWFGPTISALQSTVGRAIGGTAQGLFTLTGAVANLAPAAVGYLYGQAAATGNAAETAASSEELSRLLSTAVCFGYISSAFCFAMAARATPQLSDDRAKMS